MPIFKLTGSSNLARINGIDFALEKDLQDLVEKNIKEIFGLQLVQSEFQFKNMRIDTLAYDDEANSFVIIEYKKDNNYSVIDQGLSYLALLLNNREVFRLRYSEKINVIKKDEEIDWTQCKVIFLSPSFSIYQKGAIEFKDLPIELWEVARYDNDTIALNPIKPMEKRGSIKTIGKHSKTVGKVSRQIREYTEDEKLVQCSQHTKDLYYELRDKIKEIGNDIVVSPKRNYVAFKRNTKNFARLIPMSFGIRIRLNTSRFNIDDSRSIITSNKRGPKIDLKHNTNIQYAINLIKQAYEQAL